jgi:mannosyltransferase
VRVSKTAASLLLVLFVAIAWRCIGITFDSLWLDEGYQSIVDAYGRPLPDFTRMPAAPFVFNPGTPASPSEMLQNFRKVDPLTPPLYQLLLNRWIAWFGGADLTLRLLSVLISTICVGAVFCGVRRVFGLQSALLVGLVQAFSPFDVYYGQEVRMYALLSLMAAISCGSLILSILHYFRGAERIAGWSAYVVATWALINAHYTGLFLALYEGILGVGCAVARRSIRLFGVLVTAWLMVAVLWMPWWQMFRQAAALRTESFYVAREPSLWWPFYALLVKIPWNFVSMLAGKHVIWFAFPLYVTSGIALVLGLRALPGLERRSRLAALMIVGWAVIPCVVLWFVDVLENHKVIEIARYVMASAPAIYIIGGIGFAALLRTRSRFAIPLLFAHLFFAALNNVGHATINYQREPWRLVARRIEAIVPQTELVLVAQHYNIVCLDRYLRKPYKQVGVDSLTADARVSEILTRVPSFTLITGQEGNAFAAKVPARFQLIEEANFAHGLHLRRYSAQFSGRPS